MTTAAQLDLVIRAQDQASRTISGVSRNLSGLNSVTQAFGLGSVFAYGAATAALGSFVAMGVGELAEAQKVQAQTNAVLKSTGQVAGVTAGHVEELSSRLSMLAAVDDEVIAGGANVLLTFTNIRNSGVDKTFDRAMTAALDLSRAFGQDLQSSVIQVGKALQDPIAGVTALRRVGIQLSEAQEDQIKQFVEINDVASAQKVILGELERQVGGSAEAYGDTFAGSVAIAKLRLEEFSATIIGRTVVGLGIMADKIGDIAEGLDVFGLLERGSRDSMSAVEAEAQVWEWFNRELGTAATKAHSVQAELVYINGQLAQFGPVAPTPFGPSIEDAELLARKADEARRAIFDAIHQPSQERQTRQFMLDQAEFNVAQLQQQVDAGMGDVASGVGDFDKEGYLNWLTNEFIPAQEKWLRLDELNVDRQESAAILAQTLTGDYKNLFSVIDGKIVPTMGRYNTALYDAKGNMVDLSAFNPATLEVKTAVDKPPDPSKIKPELRSYINDVNEWLKQWPFNWGFDDPPLPPRQFTKREARKFIKDVNNFLDNFPFNWEIPDPNFPKREFTKTEAREFIKDVNDFFKGLPFNWHIPDPNFPKVEPTKEDVRAFVKDVNDFFKGLPFRWHIPDPTRPKLSDITPPLRQLITDTNTFFANTPFNWHIPTPWAPSDDSLKQKAQYIIDRIRYWWQQITNPYGGMTFNPTMLETAQSLRTQISAQVNRPDNRGIALGGGNVTINIYGADLATPAGRTYVVNNIWQTLQQRMRTG